MEQLMPPLLSIGIPTFNRAHLLKHLLRNLAHQCSSIGDEVEIVVSDNCSDDDTADLVDSYRGQLRIRYHRNDRNIGPAANVVLVPSLASGQYCWMFGDDDLLVPGALAEVLRLLREHPGIPAIVVGYSYQQEANRADYLSPDSPIVFERPVFRTTAPPRMLARWEDTFFEADKAALHTSIVSCVFARHEWEGHAAAFESLPTVESLTSLDSTFPQAIIWSSFLVGRPVLFAPVPLVYFFVGAQEWFKPKWLTIVFVFCLELAQHFRRQGATEAAVRHYESLLLRHAGLAALVVTPNEFAQAHFSLYKLVRDYGARDEIWDNLALTARRLPCRLQLSLVIRCLRASVPAPRTWRRCLVTLWGILTNSLASCMTRVAKRSLAR